MLALHNQFPIDAKITVRIIPSGLTISGIVYTTDVLTNSIVITSNNEEILILNLCSLVILCLEQHKKMSSIPEVSPTPKVPPSCSQNVTTSFAPAICSKLGDKTIYWDALSQINVQQTHCGIDAIDNAINLLVSSSKKGVRKWSKKGPNNDRQNSQLINLPDKDVEVYQGYCVKDKQCKAQCKALINAKQDQLTLYQRRDIKHNHCSCIYMKNKGLSYKAKKMLIDSSLSVSKLTVHLQAKGITNDASLRDIKKSVGAWKRNQKRNTKTERLDEVLNAINSKNMVPLDHFTSCIVNFTDIIEEQNDPFYKLHVVEHDIQSCNWSKIFIVPESAAYVLRVIQQAFPVEELDFLVVFFQNNTLQLTSFGFINYLHQFFPIVYGILKAKTWNFPCR